MNIKNINLLDISSTTAKKLLEIPYKPKVSRHNDNVLLTFVLNRDNNCPVDVFIHQEKIPNHPEVKKYIFYTNQDFVGERVFYIDTNHNVIEPGEMNSYAKNLAGIGFREQQITVEIMKKMHLNNVEIFASPNSYIFHRKCGFTVTPNKFLMAKEKFMDFLISYAKEFGIKSEKLKELMIFSTENKNFVDQGKTFEEVTNYAISQKKELPSQIYMPMHLSKNAINEWSCFINYQPILS